MQLNTQVLEEVEGCLIIKVPEPLTFTNCSDLTTRLKRVEMYGSTRAHPALKRSRDIGMTKYVIFDLKGMSSRFNSSKNSQNIVRGYRKRGIRTCFVRMSSDKHLRKMLADSGICKLLIDDLTDLKYFCHPRNRRAEFTAFNNARNGSYGRVLFVD